MAITKVADLTYGAMAKYEEVVQDLMVKHVPLYDQFINWLEPIPADGGGGTSFDWPVLGNLSPVETALTEDEDVTPVSIKDWNVTLTPYEYGNAVGKTAKASFQSRYNVREAVARRSVNNCTESLDRIFAKAIQGSGSTAPTSVRRVAGAATMVAMTGATTHNVTYAFLAELAAQARARGIEPDEGNFFRCPAHPMLIYDLQQLNQWQYPAYYSGKVERIERNEMGAIAGIRFMESPQALIHRGAGARAHTITTTTAAVSAGGTTLPVTEMSGLVVGAYVTVASAIETESVSKAADCEEVLVTAQAGASGAGNLTIEGVGNGTNLGFKFDHASGVSVVEAYDIADIPILGKNSIIGKFGSSTGRLGKHVIKDGGLDLLDRFFYAGWYWYGGIARIEKNMIMGKVALSKGSIGY